MSEPKYSVLVNYKHFTDPFGGGQSTEFYELTREVAPGVRKKVLESTDREFLEDLAGALNSRHHHEPSEPQAGIDINDPNLNLRCYVEPGVVHHCTVAGIYCVHPHPTEK